MSHTISLPRRFKYEQLLNNISWVITKDPKTAKVWKVDNDQDDSETEDIDLNQIVIDKEIFLEVSDRYNDDHRTIHIQKCTIYNILNSIYEFYKKLPDDGNISTGGNWYVGDRIFFEGISKIKDSQWFVNLGS